MKFEVDIAHNEQVRNDNILCLRRLFDHEQDRAII